MADMIGLCVEIGNGLQTQAREQLMCNHHWKQAQVDLKESIMSLKIKEEEIDEMMEVAMYRKLILNPEILDWMQEAKKSLRLTEELLEQLENLHSKCFGSTNFFEKRRLKKKVYETIEKVHCLIGEGRFEQGVSHTISNSKPAGPSSLESDDDKVGLDSMFQRVLKCLNNENKCKVIALCGMGGVGKTTLLERVRAELSKKEENKVIWVLVSKETELVCIQDKILGEIQIDPYNYENESDKARKIYETLKEKTFFLLLDDVWEGIDLRSVGIPLQADNGSNVILTTRNKIVCEKMKADEIIAVEPLSEDDAWYLFRKNFVENILDSNMTIQQIARRIVQRCGGLPLAINAVAGILRGKDDVNFWEKTLQQVIKTVGDSLGTDTLDVLKISYESLTLHVQRCFIHCCLFPEDTLIEKDMLIEQWLGRGFLDKYISEPTSSRDIGNNIIQDLVSKCLLQDKRNFVTVHHLIRYMGISTALSAGKSIVKASTNLSEVPKLEGREEVETVSLIDCHIKKLVKIPLCPQVSTLILSKNKLYSIDPYFFASFPYLTYLDLSRSGIEELPEEAMANLVCLQYLNISHTNLSKLPSSTERMVNLEVFDLSYVAQLRAIPSGLLTQLIKLKILNIFHCGYENSAKEETDALPMDSTDLLEELGQSSTLIDLGLSIVGKDGFNKLQSTEKLLHCTRQLSVAQQKKIDSLPLDSIQSMTNLDTLEISKCDDLEEIKHNLSPWGKGISNQPFFVNLHHVIIKYCWTLKELSWVCFIPHLRSLVVERCNSLTKIVSDDDIDEESKPKATIEIFASLETLYLGYLPQLESLINIPLNFDSLEALKVVSCPKLKKLPLHSKSSPHNLKIIEGDKKWWQELQWDDKLTSGALVPYYKEKLF